jgi:hypothetical protein
VQAEGLAEVSVEGVAPVEEILGVYREIKFQGVAKGGDVRCGGAFAKHLDNGVSGDEVDEEEDDGDDHPEDGERDQNAADGFGERELQGRASRSRFEVRGVRYPV